MEKRSKAFWKDNETGTISCSECGTWFPKERQPYLRFCGYCGANMDTIDIEPMKINLNDKVKIKLTAHGIKTYIDYMNDINNGRVKNPIILPKECLPTIDKDGYTTLLMWQLFSIFGKHFYMAMDPVFMPLEIIKVE